MFVAPPEPFIAPPAHGGAPPPPPPVRGTPSLPPMSVLSAPPPPAPGSPPEPPATPGSVPRLSIPLPVPGGAPPPPPVKGGLNLKVSSEAAVKGGKPPVVKPGKPGKAGKLGSVLRKRAALSPVMKAGVAVVVIAFVVAGIFFYRIFFPAPTPDVPVKLQIVVRPPPPKEDPAAIAAKAAAADQAKKAQEALAAKKLADQAKADAAAAAAADSTPTQAPPTESVMAEAAISKDVKVNNTHLDAAPAASAAFRAFVAGASIGGVFQGSPARALINGTIVREGDIVESALGISFSRIDSIQKTIYFKDGTGAQVSKNY
jgi:hypothetical protein